jgi:hypothetical protein
MSIDIRINIDLAPWQKRLIRAGVVTGAVIAALGIGIALATPHVWKTSDPLNATDLNGLNVVTVGTVSYSVGATKFCGESPTSTTGSFSYNSGALTGYQAAKAICQTSTGCNASATAHMCSAEEMVRSSQLGVTVPGQGWYSTGTYATQGAGPVVDDCYGWTAAAAGDDGAIWSPGAPSGAGDATILSCATTTPILCCD